MLDLESDEMQTQMAKLELELAMSIEETSELAEMSALDRDSAAAYIGSDRDLAAYLGRAFEAAADGALGDTEEELAVLDEAAAEAEAVAEAADGEAAAEAEAAEAEAAAAAAAEAEAAEAEARLGSMGRVACSFARRP